MNDFKYKTFSFSLSHSRFLIVRCVFVKGKLKSILFIHKFNEFFNDKARKEQMIENTTKLHNEMLNNFENWKTTSSPMLWKLYESTSLLLYIQQRLERWRFLRFYRCSIQSSLFSCDKERYWCCMYMKTERNEWNERRRK